MDDKVPCCAADAARKVRRLTIDGQSIGLVELDTVIEEVQRMAPRDDGEARRMLIARSKIYNYIPPQAEGDYAEALLREFKMSLTREGAD